MTRPAKTTIWLEKDLAVQVKGRYFGGYMGSWEQPPEEPEFEIDEVILVEGNLTKLLEYFDNRSKETIFDQLASKAVEEMQKEEV